MRSIALIGYRGAGKSSLARKAARRVHAARFDTDALVCAKKNTSIWNIFQSEGEAAFRLYEHEALVEALARAGETGGGIIATGGGIVLMEANRRLIKQTCYTIWLTAPLDVLAHRLAAARLSALPCRQAGGRQAMRPPLSDLDLREETERQLALRAPLYQSLADAILDTSAKPFDTLAEEIACVWRENDIFSVISKEENRKKR